MDRDSRHLVAYCMTAEQTLANRRPLPVPGSQSRLVSIDISSGAITEIVAGPGVKLNPTPIAGNNVGYIRKDADTESEGSKAEGQSGRICLAVDRMMSMPTIMLTMPAISQPTEPPTRGSQSAKHRIG